MPRKIKQYEVKIPKSTKVAIDQNGEFGQNGRFAYLLKMPISSKEIEKITDYSLRHSTRFRRDAIIYHGKPPKYMLTFGQFLDYFTRIDRDVLIYRFWKMKKGK
ncbi:hypothetical protein SIO70_00790 [Chitinophaga sancti]|uniref:hypothetical protein n=1 Tax=Chitinophaga sancti TaxID=1004 RepID=UPI002A7656BF|nr:hypothetical protein [Chitinophaga sancti]WPQ63398.1 hypothetical protein SIO70_00790 [Chitinophaga sancti]